jgi:endoglucanase
MKKLLSLVFLKQSLLKLSALIFVAGLAQHASAINYGESLQKSIYFYEAQQSGVKPAWNRVEWRADATVTDGADVGVDLSGGWYDAGDHVKFGFPMASSATLLAWGVVDYPSAYSQSGQLKHIKNNLRFIADYFVKAHPSANVLYGQVGTGSDDHAWWGPVEAVNETSRAASKRPSFAITETCPGTDLAGETSAALASIAMIFKESEPAYANQLITHAKQLYEFADKFRGKYSSCITDASGFYNSWSGYNDELVWSAIWLYRATGEQKYLDRATADYANLGVENQTTIHSYKWTQAWDDKSYGSYVLMAKLTGKAEYRADAERWLDFWTTGFNGDRVKYTSGGLAQLDRWGANRYAANTAFMAFVYSDFLKTIAPTNARVKTYYDFGVNQIEYILGKNPNNQCYQIGMCANGPTNPHHRTAHGSWADSLAVPAQSRHLLVGALVGGPSSGDAYTDDRSDYVMNEVATDYNAGFTSAVARLYLDFGGDPIADTQFPAKEMRDQEYFVEAKINSQGPRHIEIAAIAHNRSAWPATVNKNLKFRYWVNFSNEIAKGYTPANVTVTAAYSQAKSVSPLKSWGNAADNIYYTEVSFDGISIFPGGQSEERKEVQFRLSLPSNTNAADWGNVGDPSWDAYTDTYKNAAKIALYAGDILVWGSEPSPSCGAASGIHCELPIPPIPPIPPVPPVPPVPPAPTAGAKCEYKINDQWSDGFVAHIRITNNTTTVINGWQVAWQYPADTARTSGWNATVTGANPYIATGLAWNSTIQPGQFAEFGIQGTKPNGQAAVVPQVTGAICQ